MQTQQNLHIRQATVDDAKTLYHCKTMVWSY